jgi:hypothetical protein|tara:strand:- start:9 stop:518 length:510 start_codon:yes stop_codon:yes gene_type:complete
MIYIYLMKGFSSTSSQVFSQKPGELWNAISKENNLNDTHPFCKENEILVWNDENHQDKLVYLNGLTFIREFSEWFEGTGYNLWIGTKRGPKSYVEWRITEHSLGSELKITVYPFFFRKWPKFIAFLPYYLYINPKLTSYLNSVVGGFKWYLDKGTAVPRNHFGKHRWFS